MGIWEPCIEILNFLRLLNNFNIYIFFFHGIFAIKQILLFVFKVTNVTNEMAQNW